MGAVNKDLRKRIAKIIIKAREGHIPSSFSIVDIINFLYKNILSFKKKNPNWEKRDYFVLSKGHGCAALYVVLEKFGLLKKNVSFCCYLFKVDYIRFPFLVVTCVTSFPLSYLCNFRRYKM